MTQSAKRLLAASALVALGAGAFGINMAGAQIGGSGAPATLSIPNPLPVTGSVELGEITRSALVEPSCTLPAAPPVVTLTTTAANVPATALESRTRWRGVNESPNHAVWCCVGVDCTPTAGAHWVIPPGYGDLLLPVRSEVVRCRAAMGTADLNIQEEACGQ